MNTQNAKRALATPLLLLLLAVSVAGCFDEVVEAEYDGDPKVQFDPTSDAVLDGNGETAANLQLIAPLQPEDRRFPITVVDSLTTASADSYTLETGTAVIPADSIATDVVVNVSDVDLPPGEDAQVTLAVGDSEDGEITPAVNFRLFELTIAGETANVVLDPTSLNFGDVATDSTAQRTLNVTNVVDGLDGTLSTSLSGFEVIGADVDAFELVDSPEEDVPLASADTTELLVEFMPDEARDYEAQLAFDLTDDPDAETLTIGLTGTGIEESDDDDDDDGNGGDGDGNGGS